MEKKLIDAVQYWAHSVSHKLDRELSESEHQLRDAWYNYAASRANTCSYPKVG